MTTTEASLTASKRKVLYQILQHSQTESAYGFGDRFWVSGPTLDVLSLELNRKPHTFITTLNRLVKLELVTIDDQDDEMDAYSPTADGWRLHPRFRDMLPWIANSEGFQDWSSDHEFQDHSEDDIDQMASLSNGMKVAHTQGARRRHCSVGYHPNNEIASNYFVLPTVRTLNHLSTLVPAKSRIRWIVPCHGCLTRTTVERARAEWADMAEGHVSAYVDRCSMAEHWVESAYVANRRLYLIISSVPYE